MLAQSPYFAINKLNVVPGDVTQLEIALESASTTYTAFQFDLTLPLKVWVEAQRYHLLDFVSSMSTMHCITKLDVDELCNEYVYDVTKDCLKKDISQYNQFPTEEKFRRIIYNIPSGFCLTARMTTNYRQLKTIYNQRRKHRLLEWRRFCEQLEEFPMFRELVLGEME